MRRLVIPGGSYADALPSGRWLAVIGLHIRTDVGVLDAPDTLLSPRWSDDGTKFIAKAGNSHWLWLWDGQWQEIQKATNGTQAWIFDPHGQLHVIEPAPHVESQGIRYWDPVRGPVYGSPTYHPGTELARELGVSRLFAWTHRDGITVGQGDAGGAVIQYQGQHYLLEPGDTTFIQFRRSGPTCAVAMVTPAASVLYWFEESEIPSLPRYLLPDTGTTPPDVGTPPPPPKEEPPVSEMYLPEAVHRIVVQLSERNRNLAEGTDDDRRALTKLIAEQARYSVGPQWGWKSNHANGHAPSKDAIAFIGDEAALENQRQGMFVFDLFNGATRQPHPLPLKGEWVEQYFIPVRPVNHLGFAPPEAPPKPPPPPPDKPVDPDVERDLREQIGLLRAALADVSGVAESAIARAANAEAQTAACKVAVAELEARMDAVEHKFKRLRVGTAGPRFLAHSHPLVEE